MQSIVETVDVTPEGWGSGLIASYVVLGDRTAVIDTGPGSSYEKLKRSLESLGIEPDYVILTHIHLDHGGASGHIARDYPSVKILVHPRGAKHLANPSKLWNSARVVLGRVAEIYGEPIPVPSGNIVAVEDGYRLDLGRGVSLRIYYTPGHASHHMSILLEPEGVIFTGDSAGVSIVIDGVRVELPTTPPPFHPELYIKSLEKMKALSPRRPAPAHYGVKDEDAVEYIDREKRRLSTWYEIVREAVKRGIVDVSGVAEVLASRNSDANRAFNHSNPIVKEVFYMGTVWGLVETAKKELGIEG